MEVVSCACRVRASFCYDMQGEEDRRGEVGGGGARKKKRKSPPRFLLQNNPGRIGRDFSRGGG